MLATPVDVATVQGPWATAPTCCPHHRECRPTRFAAGPVERIVLAVVVSPAWGSSEEASPSPVDGARLLSGLRVIPSRGFKSRRLRFGSALPAECAGEALRLCFLGVRPPDPARRGFAPRTPAPGWVRARVGKATHLRLAWQVLGLAGAWLGRCLAWGCSAGWLMATLSVRGGTFGVSAGGCVRWRASTGVDSITSTKWSAWASDVPWAAARGRRRGRHVVDQGTEPCREALAQPVGGQRRGPAGPVPVRTAPARRRRRSA